MLITDLQMMAYLEAVGIPLALQMTGAAIALRETAGPGGTLINTSLNNNNPTTGDNSFGPFQINFKVPQIVTLMKSFGITDGTQLYDPKISAKAFVAICKSEKILTKALSEAWYIDHGGTYQSYYEAHLIQVHMNYLKSLTL